MCPYRIALDVERRPGNALNLEIGSAAPRCRLATPEHWPAGVGALRWLGSGGSPLVLGVCRGTLVAVADASTDGRSRVAFCASRGVAITLADEAAAAECGS